MRPADPRRPSETRTVGGRNYCSTSTAATSTSSPGRPPRAVYWVNNTLLEALTNQQMLAIAESTRPLSLTELGQWRPAVGRRGAG